MKTLIFPLILVVCQCWGPIGHKIVAYIAEYLVSDHTYALMKPLLNGKSLVYYAPLPDSFVDHTEGGEWEKPYHYADVDGKVFDINRDCPAPDYACVYGSVVNYTKRLSVHDKPCIAPDPPSPGNNPEPCNLEYITHMIADMHCPVHVTNSALFPQGGNLLEVNLTFTEWNGTNPVMHYVWDNVIIKEYIRRTWGEPVDENWRMWAEKMEKELLANKKKLLLEYQKETDPYNMAVYTNLKSNTTVNDFDRKTCILDEHYYQEAVPLINEMLEKSAARLIYILEQKLR